MSAGSINPIRSAIGLILRICRSLELPNTRIKPSEIVSVTDVKVSVVLSQRSLSSSIAVYRPCRKNRPFRCQS